jgi:hypothetical protein
MYQVEVLPENVSSLLSANLLMGSLTNGRLTCFKYNSGAQICGRFAEIQFKKSKLINRESKLM